MLRLALIFTLALCGQAYAKTQKAILAGGCFWCVEANFESLSGVRSVVSGYTGGASANPTYDSHAGYYEAVLVTFDDAQVSYDEILAKFLHSSDVVDAGGQFCDRGASYRSAIFVSDAAQKASAAAQVAKASTDLGQKVVTKVLQASKFWVAEDYHQDYYKGTGIILTRWGPKIQANAYNAYREACGRNTRIKALWGAQAAFLH